MAEWETKLESILSNPQAMEQIMSLAQSLGGNSQSEAPSAAPPSQSNDAPPSSNPPATAAPALDLSSLLGSVGQIDPKFLSIAAKFMSKMGNQDDRRTALLQSLRPFVRPERYSKLDKAIQIARLSVLIRSGIELFRKKGESDV